MMLRRLRVNVARDPLVRFTPATGVLGRGHHLQLLIKTYRGWLPANKKDGVICSGMTTADQFRFITHAKLTLTYLYHFRYG